MGLISKSEFESKLSNGLDIEKEMNKIIYMVKTNDVRFEEGEKLFDELFEYGSKSGKLSKKDVRSYVQRRNKNSNGKIRSNLGFALNLCSGQVNEHKVMLYFCEWLKKNISPNVTWELNGSDLEGYLIIVDFWNRLSKNKKLVTEPDYTICINGKSFLLEAKSFYDIIDFKVGNLEKYKKRESNLVIKCDKKYYFFRHSAIDFLLKQQTKEKWNQNVVNVTNELLQEMIKNNIVKEI